MMADVACFCGCCFSFDGGAAACPRCGEVATVMDGRPFQQNGQTPRTCQERGETCARSGSAGGAASLGSHSLRPSTPGTTGRDELNQDCGPALSYALPNSWEHARARLELLEARYDAAKPCRTRGRQARPRRPSEGSV
jgi:hypothetical protein